MKKDILELYIEFLKDPEQEVKSIAILKLPEICEKITEKNIIEFLIPLLKNLVNDLSSHVRQSIAQILVKIAKFLNIENLIEHIVPLIQKTYKDEALDVRLSIIDAQTTWRTPTSSIRLIFPKFLARVTLVTDRPSKYAFADR